MMRDEIGKRMEGVHAHAVWHPANFSRDTKVYEMILSQVLRLDLSQMAVIVKSDKQSIYWEGL